MKPSLSKKAQSLGHQKSPVREIMDYADPEYIKNLGLKPSELISFAGGWVNHEAPEGLKNAYIRIAKYGFHKSGGYSPTPGLKECRQAIADYEKHIYGMDLSAEQVLVGMGSTQLLHDLLSVLLDPGDSILLLDPSYCNYPMQVSMATDAKILRFPVLDVDSWEYAADERISEFYDFIVERKPKVTLFVIPDNPTSQVLSDEFVRAALSAMVHVGGFLVVDFAYKDIIFVNAPPAHYYSWPPSGNFVSLHSNSKWCRGLGRRLGWIEASNEIVKAMECVQNSSILCPDTMHQMALADYFEQAIRQESLWWYIADVRRKYQAAADFTVEAINELLGLPCLEPQGGLYTCVKLDMDGAKFTGDVLREAGVLFVPGWGFGKTMRNAVRVSYGPLVNDLPRIAEGFQRVRGYLRK